MKVGGFRHGHLLNMNSKSGHTKLVVVVTAGAGSIIFISVSANVSGDEDGSNILVGLVRAITSFEKMLK